MIRLTISNQRGGVAKTTTALTLARCSVERGLRVLLVDADPQGSVSAILQLKPSAFLHDLLIRRLALRECLMRSRSIRNPLGLLTHAILLCFEGSGIIRLREAWKAEKELEAHRQAEREQRDREMKQWIERQVLEWKEVLGNPAATDKEIEKRQAAHSAIRTRDSRA